MGSGLRRSGVVLEYSKDASCQKRVFMQYDIVPWIYRGPGGLAIDMRLGIS